MNTRKAHATICWECAKACGGCSWSEYAVYEPVPGWKALPGKIQEIDTWVVLECPEFVRDAEPGGLKRLSTRRDRVDRKGV